MKDLINENVDRARRIISEAAEEVRQSDPLGAAAGAARGVLDRSSQALSEGYEKFGAKKALNRGSEMLDVVSGKAVLQRLEAQLTSQACLNDVLAAKLQEALDRITALEARVSGA